MSLPVMSRLHADLARLILLRRPVKRRLLAAADFLLVCVSVYLAYVLRLESWTPRDPSHMVIVAVIAAAAAVAAFEWAGLYRAMVRYIGSPQVGPILTGIAAAIVALAIAGWVFELFVPRTVPFLFTLVAISLIVGLRLLAQRILLAADPRQGLRVAIYGAGAAGRQLSYALLSTREYAPVFFVDDDPSLHRSSVMGLPIFSPASLAELIPAYGIKRILLAVPSASPTRRRELVLALSQLPAQVLTVPSVSAIVSGSASIESLRQVTPADLLGRPAVPPSSQLMDADIRGKAVMVTGAGGTIGSELSRLVLEHDARMLLLYELSEFALYSINSELENAQRRGGSSCSVQAVLGSVRDRDRVRALIEKHGIETIYHAAAYKHVPLVEANAFEGLLNNCLGTAVVAEAANDLGVGKFVLISTDKAVRPTSVMGASKRLAELVCQDLGVRSSRTCFTMVRFGNVLDSSGSVVPLFRQQIKDGGPVTVTHPEITRYFMTIHEAAELVIQAGAMAKGGEVFVLDMGSPIRIADLARSMILLSGHNVKGDASGTGDIEIRFSGLRPGEKLHEELLIGTDVVPTMHPRISASKEKLLSRTELSAALAELVSLAADADADRLKTLLCRLPLDYAPRLESPAIPD